MVVMRIEKRQFLQTIISTGAVGAIFGLVPVLAILAFESEYGRHATPTRSLLMQALDLGLVVVASVVFCILCFGLLPMALQQGFVWLVRRWTGRD
ncbi:MAG: hypothetical protein QM795_09425 [Pseudoxanthomonas sp.]